MAQTINKNPTNWKKYTETGTHMLTKNTLYLRITKKPRWHKEKFKTAHPASNIILILLGKNGNFCARFSYLYQLIFISVFSRSNFSHIMLPKEGIAAVKWKTNHIPKAAFPKLNKKLKLYRIGQMTWLVPTSLQCLFEREAKSMELSDGLLTGNDHPFLLPSQSLV